MNKDIKWVAIIHHMFCSPGGGPSESRVIAMSVHIGATELTCSGGCWWMKWSVSPNETLAAYFLIYLIPLPNIIWLIPNTCKYDDAMGQMMGRM